MFVRWDELRVENEEERRLPGYRDGAVVRRFDAPEALNIRFYEVRAKSALNRVPEKSMVPFRWTINPYRGCTHACQFCVSGDTPLLMAHGRTKPIAEIRPGDRVYGTVFDGKYRRYVITDVLDHWSTIKHAYRVTLEDGTELVASGDHRFLTDRGWKHVTDNVNGRQQRAHLTVNNKLIGTGQFAEPPVHSAVYADGYLCGVIRGDAHLRETTFREGRRIQASFRLAMTDFEALRRTQLYLWDWDVETRRTQFAAAVGARREMQALKTSVGRDVTAIRHAIRWPDGPGPDWCKGFLAGIFDAEGCYSGSLRIANTDPEIIDVLASCMKRFGFQFRIEDYKRSNGLRNVRLLGGLPEILRFFHTTDPVITRKRSIEGMALKCPARLKVVSIERLRKPMELYDITTGTGDFIANGVVSHNCFARPTHTYLDFNAREDFEREIVVKVNVPERLRAELARPSWKREHVALGTNTDPYQWVEGRYKLMEGIWEAFRDFANPCSVLTKSPLLLRDLPLMKQVAERTSITANLSVPTLDEKAWRATEPHTPNPHARLEAVAELNRAGIPTGVLVAPLMPGINDAPEQVERILELATEAGAVHIGGIALHLRGEVREIFFDWLRAQRPDLIPRYEQLYRRGAYADRRERERLSQLVSDRAPPRGRYMRDANEVRAPAGLARERPDAESQTSLF